jgi:hypothetical protein
MILYSRSANVRLRPVPEMAQCLAYDSSGPRLYTLNTTTWLILLLCAAATREHVAAAFHREVEPLLTREEAAEHVDEALADLLAKRLIKACLASDDIVIETKQGG